MGYQRIAVIDYPGSPSWADQVDETVMMPEKKISRWKSFAEELKRFDRVFVVGADCIDGYYAASLSQRLLEIAAFATRAGCRGRVIGCSFNRSPTPNVATVLKHLPSEMKILARDPRSFRRLNGTTTATVEQVADVAFLLKPDSSLIPKTLQWISAQKGENRFVLGVNVSAIFLGKERKDEVPGMINRFAEAICATLTSNPSVSVIIIPHDVRGARSDQNICRQIYEKLNLPATDRAFFFSERLHPRAIKALANSIDACIACRMHLGIACVGSGTPIGVIPYQDKFEGLFDLYRITPPILEGDKALEDGRLESFFRETIDQAPDQKRAIEKANPRILELSRLNLD